MAKKPANYFTDAASHGEPADLSQGRPDVDRLTGIASAAPFNEKLNSLWGEGRGLVNVAFLSINVDHLRNYNDAYSYRAGDFLLAEIAQVIRSVVKASIPVYRTGGGEFGVFLDEAECDTAPAVAKGIEAAVREIATEPYKSSLQAGGQTMTSVTASIVLVRFLRPCISPFELFFAVDRAMLRAKQAGGDMVAEYYITEPRLKPMVDYEAQFDYVSEDGKPLRVAGISVLNADGSKAENMKLGDGTSVIRFDDGEGTLTTIRFDVAGTRVDETSVASTGMA
jgi:diguanylate cyclase (GGDEF)-like protein